MTDLRTLKRASAAAQLQLHCDMEDMASGRSLNDLKLAVAMLKVVPELMDLAPLLVDFVDAGGREDLAANYGQRFVRALDRIPQLIAAVTRDEGELVRRELPSRC